MTGLELAAIEVIEIKSKKIQEMIALLPKDRPLNYNEDLAPIFTQASEIEEYAKTLRETSK
ncbi:MAG: hypothetical protein WCO66_00790 [Candidatus Absconditabacteria bacterium]